MDVLATAVDNLLSPLILFFALGFAASLLRSDLSVPEGISKGLALYLMMAIGLKGGAEVAHSGGDAGMFGAMLGGVGLGFLLPVVAFFVLRSMTRLDRTDAAAVAAHYGSISVVTFVAASAYLTSQSIPFAGYMVAVVALMESPAIISGLLLSGTGSSSRGTLLREVLLNGSVVLLMGSFFIGMACGDDGRSQVAPFIDAPFKGVLCLFMLDMGIVAAAKIRSARALTPTLMSFGIGMPLFSALMATGVAWLVGLDVGSGTLLITLAASASYIAVPAAMRIALPRANPSYYLTLSLGITFPFNLVFGIPLYASIAQSLLGS